MKTTILGIDPGLAFTGYAIINYEKPKFELLSIGTLELGKIDCDVNEKLTIIYQRIFHFIKEYQVKAFAIESPFYGKNIQIAIKMGRTQGVCIAAALAHQIPFYDYAPRKVKQAVTGKGNASKEMVAGMLQNIFQTTFDEHFLDATDALAVAVCHALQSNAYSLGKSKASWKSFIEKNPDRIKKT
jgi:crossover junction endodeoxyribonuclease RuvC